MTELWHQHENTITHNTRIKVYPNGSRDIMYASKNVFRSAGWELDGKKAKNARKGVEDGEADRVRAMRRARAAVREIARCNRFSYFVTLTLDKEKVDRYDMKAITRKLNQWLDNQVRRRGLQYALVPERHKDGAIHFHGFFNDALQVVFSGHYDKGGHKIWNLPQWSLGFTTAIELYGDYEKAVGYVCKYIGKQGEKPGGRWYYSGGALLRPEVVLADMEIESIPEFAYSFEIEASRTRFWIWTEGEAVDNSVDCLRHDGEHDIDLTVLGLSSGEQTPAPGAAAPHGGEK